MRTKRRCLYLSCLPLSRDTTLCTEVCIKDNCNVIIRDGIRGVEPRTENVSFRGTHNFLFADVAVRVTRFIIPQRRWIKVMNTYAIWSEVESRLGNHCWAKAEPRAELLPRFTGRSPRGPRVSKVRGADYRRRPAGSGQRNHQHSSPWSTVRPWLLLLY